MHRAKSKGMNYAALIRDGALVLLSVLAAIALARTGMLEFILNAGKGAETLGSFIAGLFFTSVFTAAPAIVALGEISLDYGIVPTALAGAVGAVFGDLLLFQFVKQEVAEHTALITSRRGLFGRVRKIFAAKSFRWVAFLIGGLIIASPLPDELGLALLGFSKMDTKTFVLLSFVFNAAGIVLIGIAAHSL